MNLRRSGKPMTNITKLPEGHYFVFGSNEAGRHGKGAALCAKKHFGAIYGQGYGEQGQSYAVPTKDAKLKTLPLTEIKKHVDVLLEHARNHPHKTFQVTRIGCGLAGYKDHQIAPMFKGAPKNIVFLAQEWRDYDN